MVRVLENGVFEADEDAYDGMNVHIKEPMDSIHFVAMLRASISLWTKQGKRGVWIRLPIEHANLVNAAVKEGFWYHHAEATYLMMVYWIPQTPHTIPANASHRVGIGALVINDNGEGEDICDAAVREVHEEAGIKAEFVELLAFRQSHKSFFGKSDLFFVCMLKPLSYEIQKQDSEIEGAQWMPMEEYAAQPFIKKHEMFNKIAEICLAKKENKYSGFSKVLMTSAKRTYLYFNQKQFTLPEN
ncbi:hypothetical protein HAX54_046546 [Datura stramonium]|uniref:Nudix hydrolase domain-containing protein n=1 Tax=Datura stramonium TaxID=4076 RepID=A0ABS8SS39_DATST|nr:hypothetical protein [Datura stramonium]